MRWSRDRDCGPNRKPRRRGRGALELAQALPIAEAAESIPRRPGLYAIHAPAEVWMELGLGDPPDERPLYVGKAEKSLVSRDVDTHFGSGRTGSSTVRRSFAALLREPLELEGRPRNPAKPERPAWACSGCTRDSIRRARLRGSRPATPSEATPSGLEPLNE